MGLVDGSMSSETNPVVSACFRLGWRVEELHRQYQAPEHRAHVYDLARLPGLSNLTPHAWQQLVLDQVDFVISQVTAKVGTPADVPLNLTADTRRKLEAVSEESATASGRAEYRTALSELHENLLITLTAADASYGKAYGLGRALADTTRAHQTPGQLASSFESLQIDHIYVWLDELASLLPQHAARAVAQSLIWWRYAVAAAAAGEKLSSSLMPGNHPSDRTSHQPAWKRTAEALRPGHHRTQHQVDPPSLDSLSVAVVRQGALWRGILDGDKQSTDLLNTQDYLRAGDMLAHRYAELVGRVLRTMPWLLLLPLSFLAVVVVLWTIPGSAVARAATGVAAFAGTLSGTWRAVRARVAPIAMQLEQPLWGSELDTATAEAATIPPVGAPQDAVLESACKRAATDVITAATQPQQVSQPVRSSSP